MTPEPDPPTPPELKIVFGSGAGNTQIGSDWYAEYDWIEVNDVRYMIQVKYYNTDLGRYDSRFGHFIVPYGATHGVIGYNATSSSSHVDVVNGVSYYGGDWNNPSIEYFSEFVTSEHVQDIGVDVGGTTEYDFTLP